MLTTFLTFVFASCFFTAYPSNTISLNETSHFEVSKHTIEHSSVKPTSYLHTNDSFERIASHVQHIVTPVYAKELNDADIKSYINKHQTLIKRNKYKQYSRQLFLSFLSTDIIFPFHTFW
ncbi:hypothetical protein [Psychroserpens sp. SPM9]|uniref:hypothetical protein n=1 Tax=Psychroserpens sp. SPM9 TaxID=2975598 RepID=UPI0021A5E5D0|nr:hypothetical protein [Psychroserpens sp. SPM9]MDG5491238.1 hypothetical protein [Psychroserpens sp. SPM9]